MPTFVNLTPHPIVLALPSGRLVTFPRSGQLATLRIPVQTTHAISIRADSRFTDADGNKIEGRYLKDAARKVFVTAFEELMHTEVTHPLLGKPATYRQCIDVQVQQLLRAIEHHKLYIPFLMHK